MAYFSENLEKAGIFKNKRTVMLAADHPYFGVVGGIENTEAVLLPLIEYADAIMIAPGTFTKYPLLRKTLLDSQKPVILRASGCVSTFEIPGEDDSMAREHLIISAKRAKELGASALAVSVYIGTKYEDQTLLNLANMAEQAYYEKIPVLGVVAVGKRLTDKEKDSNFIIRASRIVAEHGADFVKTYNCGSEFVNAIKACPVPVVVAGGKEPIKDITKSTLELAYNSIHAGASGIDFGRRVWRHAMPVEMLKTLHEIVHNNKSVDEVLANYPVLKTADSVQPQ